MRRRIFRSRHSCLNTPAPSARYRRRRWSACRCAPAGSRCVTVPVLGVEPGQRVLHPVLVVALGKILARVRAAAFGAVERPQSMVTTACTIRLSNSSVSTRSEFQISERSVTRMSSVAVADLVDQLRALLAAPRRCGTRRSSSASPSACAARSSRGRRAALGVAELVEAGRAPARRHPSAGRGCLSSGVDDLGAAQRRGAAEHDEVDQRIGAEPVGAVHRDAGRLAERHQAGHDVVGIAVLLGQRLAVIVRGDAAHVVVHGRQHRDRLAGDDRRRRRCAPISVMPGSRSCRIFGSRWSRCR